MKIYTRDNFISAAAQSYPDFEAMMKAPQMNPPAMVDSKAKWKQWLEAPTTKRHIYSYNGGIQSTQIVSSNNAIFDVNGFIFDIDEKIDENDLVARITAECPKDILPTYMVQSYSGGWHLLYPFDGAVGMLDGQEFAAVVSVFYALSKLSKVSSKVDTKAMKDCSQYYTFGQRWVRPFPKKKTLISKASIHLYQYQIGNNGMFDSVGVVIPFEKIEEEMNKRFPNHGYAHVADGARGKRFWDATAKDPTAAVLRSTGVQYFSDMGGFMSWAAIFGDSFVRDHQTDSVGAALASIYFDGTRYYHRVRDDWAIDTIDTIKNLLKVRYGLSIKMVKGKGFSQLEEVLCNIQQSGRVAGAAPFLFTDELIVNYGGKRWVNVSTTRAMRPSEYDPVDWGDKFPNISRWLDHFWGDEFQKHVFLAWLRHYYESALRGVPSKGQALINVGGVHVGKTLLTTQVVSRMFGTSFDISPFMTGEESFNKEMFHSGVNFIDDQIGFSNYKLRERFSSMLKKLVANTEMPYTAKFKDTIKLPFFSRIMIAMNDDAQSLEVLPVLTDSIRDKVIILKCNDSPYAFPPGFQMQDLIIPELPYFCKWLLGWTPPDEVVAKNRYGVVSFIHPVMEDEARVDDDESIIDQLLRNWTISYFRSIEAKDESVVWKSTSQLFGDFRTFDSALEPELRNRWTVARFGRILNRVIKRNNYKWVSRVRRSSGAGYLVDRSGVEEIEKFENEDQH